MLVDLAGTVRATVVLVAYIETERMVVDVARTMGSLAPYYRTWLDGPLYASGSGKALLLSLSPERRQALLGKGPYPAITPYSITEPERLAAELVTAANRGFVVARDEQIVGLTAIATNIPTWQGQSFGCLVMTGHTRDCNDAHTAYAGDQLIRVAELIRHQSPSLSALSHYLAKSAWPPEK